MKFIENMFCLCTWTVKPHLECIICPDTADNVRIEHDIRIVVFLEPKYYMNQHGQRCRGAKANASAHDIDQTCRLAVCMVQPSAIANMISVDPIVIEWSIDGA